MSASTKIRKGGSWQTITGCKVFSSGKWRTIIAIRVYSGGAWRLVANFTPPSGGGGGGGGSGGGGGGGGGSGGGGTIVLVVSPATMGAGGSTSSITSGEATATPSGGLAPYTYLWTGDVTALSPTLATTAFRKSGNIVGEPTDALMTCTCTDSLGVTASDDCTITFTRT